ncbi:MAG TPA: sulfite exporter TauE/SafE family protein [Limnobacter sp.]|nr:sulfite exporter TauE/SafE family protein [Limnobacter sp.]
MPLDPNALLPAVLGLAIGAVMGLTGAGGGVLAVPLLVYALGMSVQSAAPIGLLAVGLAAVLGAALGLKAGEVRYKAAALMGTVGLLASPVGLWAASLTDTRVLSALFAVVLIWVAYNAFRYRPTQGLVEIDTPQEDIKSTCPCVRNPKTGRFVWTWPCARALAGSGALAGFMSGLLGVGGGFVLVPALQRFTDLTLQSVTVTSLAVIAIVSTFGVINSASGGAFDMQLAFVFSTGAMAGMLTGRALSGRMPIHYLKWSFGLVCLGVAALMVGKAMGH